MKTYTITQVRHLLSVDNKTLARWLDRAGITPQGSEHDERVKRISREELERLASIHERPIGSLPLEKEVHPTVKALERKITEQGKELAQLNTVLYAFMKSVDEQLHDLREVEIKTLQDRIEQLTEQLALQRNKTANRPRVADGHTSDTLPAQNAPTARTGPAPYRIMVDSLDELPPDAIPLSEFAAQHGIENSKAFREQRIDKYFAHYAYRNERRPREVKRFVTVEQQNAILKQ